jgi:hypothetical protein
MLLEYYVTSKVAESAGEMLELDGDAERGSTMDVWMNECKRLKSLDVVRDQESVWKWVRKERRKGRRKGETLIL